MTTSSLSISLSIWDVMKKNAFHDVIYVMIYAMYIVLISTLSCLWFVLVYLDALGQTIRQVKLLEMRSPRAPCDALLLRLSLSFTNPCIHFNSNIPDLLLTERGKYRVWVMVFKVTFNNISPTSWRGTCKFKYYQLISISIIFKILRFIPIRDPEYYY
jgi:hypothetical protein